MIRDQAVPRLKSLQEPRMWPKSYLIYHRDKWPEYEEWSKRTFQPQLIQRTGNKNGTMDMVEPVMQSLSSLGLGMQPPYDEHEIALRKPSIVLKLKTFSNYDSSKRTTFNLPQKHEWDDYFTHKRPDRPSASMVIDS